MATAAPREQRPSATQPSFDKMGAAATKYPAWDQAAYENLKRSSPSNQKNSTEFAEFLVLKGQRPKAYRKGDDVGF